jgi:hypothetical protein
MRSTSPSSAGADIVLREAESRLFATIESTVRCVQNRARLARALYERLDRFEAARTQAVGPPAGSCRGPGRTAVVGRPQA